MDNKKIANINIKLKDLFFKWVDITTPFHRLTKQKKDVLSLLLYNYYKYYKITEDQKIIWKMVFDIDTRESIKEDLDINDPVFQNILSFFRKKKIIIDKRINKIYIPNLSKDAKNFKVLFNFNIVDNE